MPLALVIVMWTYRNPRFGLAIDALPVDAAREGTLIDESVTAFVPSLLTATVVVPRAFVLPVLRMIAPKLTGPLLPQSTTTVAGVAAVSVPVSVFATDPI